MKLEHFDLIDSVIILLQYIIHLVLLFEVCVYSLLVYDVHRYNAYVVRI